MGFELHHRLAEDAYEIGSLPLSRLLLMNDSRYPWFILVPARAGITEIHDLAGSDQNQLIKESVLVSRMMKHLFKADKMNVASLGNVVSQLHIHHIARYHNDEYWPAPIWGMGKTVPYEPSERKKMISHGETILDAI